jgi:hypothetical protein
VEDDGWGWDDDVELEDQVDKENEKHPIGTKVCVQGNHKLSCCQFQNIEFALSRNSPAVISFVSWVVYEDVEQEDLNISELDASVVGQGEITNEQDDGAKPGSMP